jgi:hypothetical protein
LIELKACLYHFLLSSSSPEPWCILSICFDSSSLSLNFDWQ